MNSEATCFTPACLGQEYRLNSRKNYDFVARLCLLEAKDGHLERKERHLEAKDGHLERRERHLEAKDGHLERRERHLEAKDGHLERRERHPEAKDGHLERRERHLEAKDDHLVRRNYLLSMLFKLRKESQPSLDGACWTGFKSCCFY